MRSDIETEVIVILGAAVVAVVLAGVCRGVQTLTVDRGEGPLAWSAAATVGLVAVAALVVLAVLFWRTRLDTTDPGAFTLALVCSVVVLGLVVEAFAGVTTLGWRLGWLEAASGQGPSLWAAERHYLWHLLDSVPLLDIPGTVGWDEPGVFDDGRSGALLLAFQVVLIGPLLRLGFGAYQLVEAGAVSSRARRHDLASRGIDQPLPWYDEPWFRWGRNVRLIFGALLLIVSAGVALLVLLAEPTSVVNREIERRTAEGIDIRDWHVDLGWLTAVTPFVALVGFYGLGYMTGVTLYEARLTWADRAVAVALGAATYLLVAALVIVAGAAATLAFVRVGIADLSPASDGHVAGGVVQTYVWQMLDSLPGPEVASTLHWQPDYEINGVPAGLVLLVAKAAFLVILLFPIARLARSYRRRIQPGPTPPALLDAATGFASRLGAAQAALENQDSFPGFKEEAAARHAIDDVLVTLGQVVALLGPGVTVEAAHTAAGALTRWYEANSGTPFERIKRMHTHAGQHALDRPVPDVRQDARQTVESYRRAAAALLRRHAIDLAPQPSSENDPEP